MIQNKPRGRVYEILKFSNTGSKALLLLSSKRATKAILEMITRRQYRFFLQSSYIKILWRKNFFLLYKMLHLVDSICEIEGHRWMVKSTYRTLWQDYLGTGALLLSTTFECFRTFSTLMRCLILIWNINFLFHTAWNIRDCGASLWGVRRVLAQALTTYTLRELRGDEQRY